MTIAAMRLGMSGSADANDGGPRELAALANAAEWLNSPPLTPSTLAGKVVVVNFWTFTCINWLRTLPSLRAWSQKYRQGLVVIGVHTPEFPFEHTVDNVRRAVRQMGIEYPVVIDNEYSIWRAFGNQYWPALYFVDTKGRVRQRQFGEGESDRSENAIRRLLAEAGVAPSGSGDAVIDARGIEAPADWANLRSPENYVGYDRTQNFASRGGAKTDRAHTYSVPSRLALNQWALSGGWTIGRQAIVLGGPNGRIACRFHARDLHLVLAPPAQGGSARFRVCLDGQPPGPAHGLDLDERGNGTVAEPRLYQVIRQSNPIVDRQFEIEFLDAGVEAFAFTFG